MGKHIQQQRSNGLPRCLPVVISVLAGPVGCDGGGEDAVTGLLERGEFIFDVTFECRISGLENLQTFQTRGEFRPIIGDFSAAGVFFTAAAGEGVPVGFTIEVDSLPKFFGYANGGFVNVVKRIVEMMSQMFSVSFYCFYAV